MFSVSLLLSTVAGADETKLTREALKWPYGEFEIPDEVYDTFSAAEKKGKKAEEEWKKVKPLIVMMLSGMPSGMPKNDFWTLLQQSQ